MFTKLKLTPHSNLLTEGKKVGAVEWHGCESCHGPGSAHVEGGGDVTKIISFKNLSVQDASARCLTCHSLGAEHANFIALIARDQWNRLPELSFSASRKNRPRRC